jgi:hypothetical protein
MSVDLGSCCIGMVVAEEGKLIHGNIVMRVLTGLGLSGCFWWVRSMLPSRFQGTGVHGSGERVSDEGIFNITGLERAACFVLDAGVSKDGFPMAKHAPQAFTSARQASRPGRSSTV